MNTGRLVVTLACLAAFGEILALAEPKKPKATWIDDMLYSTTVGWYGTPNKIGGPTTLADLVKGKDTKESREIIFRKFASCRMLANGAREAINSQADLQKKYKKLLTSENVDAFGVVQLDSTTLYEFTKSEGVRDPEGLEKKFPELLDMVKGETCAKAARIMFRTRGLDDPPGTNLCVDSENADQDVDFHIPIRQQSGPPVNVYPLHGPDEYGDGKGHPVGKCTQDCRPNPGNSLNAAGDPFVCKSMNDWGLENAAIEKARALQKCDGVNPGYCGPSKYDVLPAALRNTVTDSYKTFLPDFTDQTNSFLYDTFLESYLQNAALMSKDGNVDDLVASLKAKLNSCAMNKTVTEITRKGTGCKRWGKDELICPGDVTGYNTTYSVNENQKRAAAKLDALTATLKKVQAAGGGEDARKKYLMGMGQGAECLKALKERYDKLMVILHPEITDYAIRWKPDGFGEKLADFAMSFHPVTAVAKMFLKMGIFSKPLIEAATCLPSGDSPSGGKCSGSDEITQDMCGPFKTLFTERLHDHSSVQYNGVKYNVSYHNQDSFCATIATEYANVGNQMSQIYQKYPGLFEPVPGDDKVTSYQSVNASYKLLGGTADPGATGYRKGLDLMDVYEGAKRICMYPDDHPTKAGTPFVDSQTGKALTSANCNDFTDERGVKLPYLMFSHDYTNDQFHDLDGSGKSCMDSLQNAPNDKHGLAASQALAKSVKPQLDKLGDAVKDMVCSPDPESYRDSVLRNPDMLALYFDCQHRPFDRLAKLQGQNASNADPTVDPKECAGRVDQAWIACMRKDEVAEEDKKKAIDAKAEAKRQDSIEGAMLAFEAAASVIPGGGRLRFSVGGMVKGAAIGGAAAFVVTAGLQAAGLVPTSSDIAAANDAKKKAANFTLAELYAGYGNIDKALAASDTLASIAKQEGELGPMTRAILMGMAFGAVGGMFGEQTFSFKNFSKDEADEFAHSALKAKGLPLEDLKVALSAWRASVLKSSVLRGELSSMEAGLREILDARFLKEFGIDLKGFKNLRDLTLEDRLTMLRDPRLEGMSGADRLAMFMNKDIKDLSFEERLQLYKDKALAEKYPNFMDRVAAIRKARPSLPAKVVGGVKDFGKSLGSSKNLDEYADAQIAGEFFKDPAKILAEPKKIPQMEKALRETGSSREDVLNTIRNEKDSGKAADAYLKFVRDDLEKTYGKNLKNVKDPDQLIALSEVEEHIAALEKAGVISKAKAAAQRKALRDFAEGKIQCLKELSSCFYSVGAEVGFRPSIPRIRQLGEVYQGREFTNLQPASGEVLLAAGDKLRKMNEDSRGKVDSAFPDQWAESASDYLKAQGINHVVRRGADGELEIQILTDGDSELNRFAARMMNTNGTAVQFNPSLFFQKDAGGLTSNGAEAIYMDRSNRLILAPDAVLHSDHAPMNLAVQHEVGHSDTTAAVAKGKTSPYHGKGTADKPDVLPGGGDVTKVDGYSRFMAVDEAQQWFKDAGRFSKGQLIPSLENPAMSSRAILQMDGELNGAEIVNNRGLSTTDATLAAIKDGKAKVEYVRDQYGKVTAQVRVPGEKGGFTYEIPLVNSKGLADAAGNAKLVEDQLRSSVETMKEQEAILLQARLIYEKLRAAGENDPLRAVYAKALDNLLEQRGITKPHPAPGEVGHAPIQSVGQFQADLDAEFKSMVADSQSAVRKQFQGIAGKAGDKEITIVKSDGTVVTGKVKVTKTGDEVTVQVTQGDGKVVKIPEKDLDMGKSIDSWKSKKPGKGEPKAPRAPPGPVAKSAAKNYDYVSKPAPLPVSSYAGPYSLVTQSPGIAKDLDELSTLAPELDKFAADFATKNGRQPTLQEAAVYSLSRRVRVGEKLEELAAKYESQYPALAKSLRDFKNHPDVAVADDSFAKLAQEANKNPDKFGATYSPTDAAQRGYVWSLFKKTQSELGEVQGFARLDHTVERGWYLNDSTVAQGTRKMADDFKLGAKTYEAYQAKYPRIFRDELMPKPPQGKTVAEAMKDTAYRDQAVAKVRVWLKDKEFDISRDLGGGKTAWTETKTYTKVIDEQALTEVGPGGKSILMQAQENAQIRQLMGMDGSVQLELYAPLGITDGARARLAAAGVTVVP